MENKIKDIIGKDDKNKIDKVENEMKDEISNINEFHFSFENKEEINFKDVIPHISENENEKIEKTIINDFEEDNKEENSVYESILNDLNKNIEINIKELENENKNFKECQEILEILKYPLSDKNIRNDISPFKPLLKPKQISLIGRVLIDNNNSMNNSTDYTSSNVNNNGKI